MSEKNIQKTHFFYSVVLGVLALAVAVLFIISCVDIYNSGDRPFSEENIKAHFSKIAFPVCIFVILTVGGFVLNVAIPAEKAKTKSSPSASVTLKRLSARLDLENCTVENGAGILIRRKIRQILIIFTAIIYLLRSVHALIYILNPDNFPGINANAEVLKGTVTVLINLAVPFVISIAVSLINRKLIKDEIALTKKALVEQKNFTPAAPENKNFFSKLISFFKRNERSVTVISRTALIVLGAVFIGAGIWNGGAGDVLQKAIKICTECIGLG